MNDYLKHYQVKITALSPIYIGSGVQIGKKEYIYMPWNHHVIVPDIQKMYVDISKKGYQKEFEKYMMGTQEKTQALGGWLNQRGFSGEDYKRWKLYEMDAGEAFASKKEKPPKGISAFVKDAYGMPYVPGSSIKGMFRTAIIANEIRNHPQRYAGMKNEIYQKSRERLNKNRYLTKESKSLEQQILNTLERDEKRIGSAVNDNFAGLHVGDSRPISVEQLTLCQKIDYTLKGEEKPFPILWETIIPGTEICFDVSIDTSVCPYEMEEIVDALNEFQEISYQYFYSRFRRGTRKKDVVWLGGGCGFLSKTIVYPMFESEAYKVVDNINKNNLGGLYNVHKHSRDLGLKLAPHVCKCTKYQGKLYDMGMGQISYFED